MKTTPLLSAPIVLAAVATLVPVVEVRGEVAANGVAPAPAGPAEAVPAPLRRSRAPRPWRDDHAQRLSVAQPPVVEDAAVLAGAQRVVMAGSLDVWPPDNPELRIDQNSLSSPYRGICSVVVERPNGTGMCSGTPISRRHVLTAGHCFDWNDDGAVDADASVSVIFNVTGPESHVIGPAGITFIDMHPDFTGFANPSTNDDLTVITLAEPLPEEIPHYPPFRDALAGGEQITFVGYGQSGHGASGPTVDGDRHVKRTGANRAEQFFFDDEDGVVLETWRADFDGPTADTNCFGSVTLGNQIETSVAPGDSGGAALVEVDGALHLWGVNTFIVNCLGPATVYGGTCGGLAVNAYLPWIDEFLVCAGNCADCNANGIADGVDIEDGTSPDLDGNRIPDECGIPAPGDAWIANTNNHIRYSYLAGDIVEIQDNQVKFVRSIRYAPDGRMLAAARVGIGNGVYELDLATGDLVGTVLDQGDGASYPTDIAFGPNGWMYVLNSVSVFGEGYITRHDPTTGDLVDVFVADDPATPEPEHGGLADPMFMEFGPDGDLYVTDRTQLAVLRFDGDTGAFIGPFAETVPGLGGNSELEFRDGFLYVARWHLGDVIRFDAVTGAYVDTFISGGHSLNTLDIAWGPDGMLYLLDNSLKELNRFDPDTGAHVDTVLDGSPLGFLSCFEFIPESAPPCPADFDGSGNVDFHDLLAILMAWGDCAACPEDLDEDGAVGFSDLLLLLGALGECG